MKRELTLQFGQQEIAVTAHREGNAIVVSRGEDTFTVTITGEKIIGSTVAVAPAAAAAAAAPAPSRPAVAPSSAAAPATPAGGPGVVPSPMTGVVDKILVQDGTVVAEGEKVLILEAMKMYIDVTAPASGTVSGIAVKSGDSIKEGQALMTIQ